MRFHVSMFLTLALAGAAEAQTVRLPTSVALDEPAAWRVDGLPPGARIEVVMERVTTTGQTASSTTPFLVPADGTIDPERDAPVAGYVGADPSGPFWTMAPRPRTDDPSKRGRLTLRVQ